MTAIYILGNGHLLGKSGGVWTNSPSFQTLVSRSLSSFASSGTAVNANSSNYNNILTSTGTPVTIAYDLSTLTAEQISQMRVWWYNDASTLYLDSATAGPGGDLVNVPTAYTIEGNAGAGGGSPPGGGWVTLATVSSNTYTQRMHLLSLTGYNWIRLNITGSSDTNVGLKFDLYDKGLETDWLVLGDSRCYFSMGHNNAGGTSCASFGDLVAAGAFGRVVPQLNAGMSGFKAADMDTNINAYLSAFPIKRVMINIGVNDATATPWFSGWNVSMNSLLQKILATGATPFLETIGYSTSGSLNTIIQGYNAQIPGLISGNSGTQTGVDMYSVWQTNSGLISGDDLHMTDPGRAVERQARATFASNWMATH